MSFNAGIPAASDSPGIFPAQNQTNMNRLQTIIGADHQFNLSAAANDGYHNLIHMNVPNPLPSGSLASIGRLYTNSSGGNVQLFYMDDAGNGFQMSPSMPIRASVNFDGQGAVGAQGLRSSYNVSSVQKTATGAYTVNFTTAMPNNNYIVHITGMRNISDASIGFVQGSGTYGNSVSTSFVKVQFWGGSGTAKDVVMGNVTIMSTT